jgi:hypothetical protein
MKGNAMERGADARVYRRLLAAARWVAALLQSTIRRDGTVREADLDLTVLRDIRGGGSNGKNVMRAKDRQLSPSIHAGPRGNVSKVGGCRASGAVKRGAAPHYGRPG